MVSPDMMAEYQLLTSQPALGVYNCCEVTTVFLWSKKEQRAWNYFTIAVFEERLHPILGKKNLSPKLLPITNGISMGIEQSVLSMGEAKKLFEHLCCVSDEKAINIGNGNLQIGTLEAVFRAFVPHGDVSEVPLNRLLKNNFINGSYILEFFDVTKDVHKQLTDDSQKTAAEMLRKYLPIDLFPLPDRIGNFIFQFPSLNVRVSYEQGSSENTLAYHISLDPRIRRPEQLQLLSEIRQDGNVVGFGTFLCQGHQMTTELQVEDAGRLCRTTLLERESQLILSCQETRKMEKLQFNITVDSSRGDKRVIWDHAGQNPVTISVKTIMRSRVNLSRDILRNEPIQIRQYSERAKVLEKRLEFRRYHAGDRERALNDIRALMNRNGYEKAYLWDPYLSVEDLLDTWYYTTAYGVPLYAITSKMAVNEKSPLGEPKISEWIQCQRKIMNQRSNHYGICLELRCQWGVHGYSFHDRFLILVKEDAPPDVWSLGTSVNSLGTSHHILQSVAHPRLIADAFEELWEMLDAEECIVWKSGACYDE